MTLRNIFQLLFVLLSCVLSYTTAEFRIIDGQDIDIESSPHTVAIFCNNFYECVGSIVSTTSVVTAAHCVAGKGVQSLSVLAGVTNINEKTGQPRCVTEVHVDPSYTILSEFMDIAIVKVHKPFDLNDARVQKIELCDDRLGTGSWMQISGWGWLDENDGTPSPLLKTKSVQIKECRFAYGNIKIPAIIAETIICAGRSGEDMWFGDSGAAGVWNGRLCAVARSKSGVKNAPGKYIEVTNPKVRDFITTRI